MTCWWGWYTVYWAEALNTSKGRKGRIIMAGENAREKPRDERTALELEDSREREKTIDELNKLS
jgi:hypothetical protein